MAIELKAPLAAQLFALGAKPGEERFSYQGNSPKGFRQGSLPQSPSTQVQEEDTGGRTKALASVAGALASKYAANTSAPSSDTGVGFELGKDLVSGDAGNATYAKGSQVGILESLMPPKKENSGSIFGYSTY